MHISIPSQRVIIKKEERTGREAREGEGKMSRPPLEMAYDDFDDDGLPRRTGTLWTASAHIVTAVIGSGVLSLAWATAQLGWVFGPLALVLFSTITFYASTLLADSYRTSDPVNGKRNHSYAEAVKSNLGGFRFFLCGLFQYINLFGTSIGYTLTAGTSAAALSKSNCYHKNGHQADCLVSYTYYMVAFAIVQIILSQLPNFHKLSWLSILAAIMSFGYSFIGVGLSFAKVVSGDVGKTSITGTIVGVDTTSSEKMWNAMQALGNIAFAYSYSMILIEIQDTLKSSPPENKVMKKASFVGVSTTTIFYISCGCLGYAAFGNQAPGNMLTGFGFYEPYWLINIANVFIVVHLLGGYQVYCQPLFAAVEGCVSRIYPNSKLLSQEHPIKIGASFTFNFNMFRLLWRTSYVVITTLLALVMPFFNDILSFLGAVGFWPLTVYFPVEMYLKREKIKMFAPKWMLLQTLSFLCLLVSLAAAVASVVGVIQSLQSYKPFQTRS